MDLEAVPSPSPAPLPSIATDEVIDKALAADPGATAAKSDASEADYRVSLPCFEGPLDLLLHLIRKEQLNIYDIPITHICRAYLEHLEILQQLDFNMAGEFMVMASTLMYLKSATLLPNEDAEQGAEDPRLPLVAQLLEYEKYKLAAQAIDNTHWLGRDLYARPPGALADVIPVESLIDAPIEQADPLALLKGLKACIDRTERPPIKIETDTVSIKDKVVLLRDLLLAAEVIEFSRLLPAELLTHDVIVSFLAVLELAKLKFVEIIQTENFGPMQVRAQRSMEELNYGLLDQY
ncbi:segregation/condensation protein A [bacterium]|nr:segregation/condensation protein A [bacterium]